LKRTTFPAFHFYGVFVRPAAIPLEGRFPNGVFLDNLGIEAFAELLLHSGRLRWIVGRPGASPLTGDIRNRFTGLRVLGLGKANSQGQREPAQGQPKTTAYHRCLSFPFSTIQRSIGTLGFLSHGRAWFLSNGEQGVCERTLQYVYGLPNASRFLVSSRLCGQSGGTTTNLEDSKET
jgi:hypothetical protein